jgi:hypothetical protein
MQVNRMADVFVIMNGNDVEAIDSASRIVGELKLILLNKEDTATLDIIEINKVSLTYSKETGNWYAAPNSPERRLINTLGAELVRIGIAHVIQIVSVQRNQFSKLRQNGIKVKDGWFVVAMKHAPLHSIHHLIK